MKATENGKKLKPQRAQRAQRHKLLLSIENTADTEKSKIKPWDEITIKSWKEFCDYCNKQQGSTLPEIYEGIVIFRGQPCADRLLEPSLHRELSKRGILSSDMMRKFKEQMMKKFNENWPLPYIDYYAKYNLYAYIVSIMQHYSTGTILLDWTSDWRVAACFATEGDKEKRDRQHDDCDGAVWCIYKTQIETRLKKHCINKDIENLRQKLVVLLKKLLIYHHCLMVLRKKLLANMKRFLVIPAKMLLTDV